MDKTRKTLKKLGIKPVEGQNFLTSKHIIKALVKAGETENQTVLEIGPGTGTITEKLAENSEKVYAVEKDTTLAQHLKQKFKENEKVEILNQDITEYQITEEIDRCVSNPPFQHTTEIIEKLGENQIQSALILQEELADKIVADPGQSEYGYTTIKTQYYYLPVKLQTVKARNYYPQPEVDTSIIKLYPNKERHGVENEQRFFQFAKALFTHKRKKTRNAIVDARNILGYEKNQIKEIRDQLPNSEKRVIQLNVKELKELEKEFREKIEKK